MSYQTTANGSVQTAQKASSVVSQSDPEVRPKAKRRMFSAEYKRQILREAERCDQSGQVGALLRREGLYSSHLTDWRRQEEAGQLSGAKASKRGRKAKQTAAEKESAMLRAENAKLRQQLHEAQLLLEAQKKVAELLELFSRPQKGQLL